MKISIFLGGLSGGGSERVVCNLANYLINHNHNVDIITMSDDAASYELSNKVNRIILLSQSERRNQIYNSLLRIKRLRAYMRNTDTEEYLVMLPTTIVLLLLMRRNTTAPIIVSERADPNRISRIIQVVLKKLVKFAAGFVFQTEDARQWYLPYIGNAKTIVIPNAINPEFLENSSQMIKKDNKVVAIGRFTDQKNFPLLIRAFAGIHGEFPNVKLIIYGDGPQRATLLGLVNELDIEDCVEFPGYVKEIKESIQTARLFVLSSDFEGIPNALMEAMALGIPCISTDCPVGGPRSLIEEGKNGILVPVGDEKELREAIKSLLGNEAYAEGLGRNAKRITDKLNPDIIYSQWEDYLMTFCKE